MKLQVVVVIYKLEIGASKTIATLYSLGRRPGLEISLLIYDNSPSPQICDHPIAKIFPVTYINDPTNGRLVPAYNRGLKMAEDSRTEWLLLLDDDTVLTAQYFETLARALSDHGDDPSVAAFVPHIIVRGKHVAPTWFSIGIHRRMKTSWHGLAEKPITTINSVSVVRTSFLRSLGGFDRQYPFNYTDYWFYREVYRHKKKVVVIDSSIDHAMTSSNRDTFRPVPQYRDVLYHEGLFYRSSGSRLIVFVFWSRLMLRVVKHYFVFKDKGYSLATLSYIRRELLHKSQ